MKLSLRTFVLWVFVLCEIVREFTGQINKYLGPFFWLRHCGTSQWAGRNDAGMNRYCGVAFTPVRK